MRKDFLGVTLRSSNLFEIIQDAGDIEMPGLKEGEHTEEDEIRQRIFRAIGQRMRSCLGRKSEVDLDGYVVERRITTNPDDDYRERREFCFRLAEPPKSPLSHPEVTPEEKARDPECPEGTKNIYYGSSFNILLGSDSGVGGTSGSIGEAAPPHASHQTISETEVWEF